MSMSSLSCEQPMADSSDDESVGSLEVPPPPPHLELLELAGDNGACAAHIVSYLDDSGRRAAASACVYLKDAVRDYDASMRDEAVGDGGSMVEDELLPLDEAPGPEPTVESPRRVADFPGPETKPGADETSPEDIRDLLAAEVEASKLKQKEAEKNKRREQRRLLANEVSARQDELEKLRKEEKLAHEERLANQKWMEGEDAKRQLAEVEAKLARGQAVAAAAIKLAEDEILAERRLSEVAEEPNTRDVLEEMNDLDEGIPKRPPVAATPDVDEEGVQEEVLEEEFSSQCDGSSPPSLTAPPSLETVSLSEEKVDADAADEGEESLVTEDLDSISTDMKAQGEQFLARVNLSGVSTPLSFVSSVSSTAYSEEKDGEEGDELSAIPTVSHTTGFMSTPTTPLVSTLSPKSLSEAKRLEIGGASHLGDGRRLHIVGRAMAREMEQSSEGIYEEAQPALPYDNERPTFTRLRDLRNSKEDTPFDEEPPLVSRSTSSVESPYQIPNVPPSPGNETARSGTSEVSDLSSETETTADVLAQFSDAALFGDTPKVLNNLVSDFVGSAKSAVSHLYTERKQNCIDDSGPIKIGGKYYSHNEALQLWRKAKVKLEDSYQEVDKDGNVKVEQAPFFEKNSIFEERSVTEAREREEDDKLRRTGKKFKSKSEVRKQQGAVSINEFISRYSLLQPSKSADESTLMAGNMVDGRRVGKLSKKTVSFMSPVSEDCEDMDSEASHASFDDANETAGTAETASLTKSDGSDGEADRFSIDTETGSEASGAKRAKGEQDVDSVAGKDSLPSHMGSAYGVEVSSVRGRHCTFVDGKSSEQIKGAGGCDQSVLGSQYGTEVLFKPKKKGFTAARKRRTKPRTLARHNMGLKSAKPSGAGANASKQCAAAKQSTGKPASKETTASKSSPPRKSLTIPLKLKLGMKKTAVKA